MTPSSLSNPWVIRFEPRTQARLRLFCFAYAGGGASVFRPWAKALPADIEICSIQLPGRENRMREPAYVRIEPLLDQLATAIAPFLSPPYAFFGYSMGSLISFELAHALRQRQQKEPVHLFVSARRAPQIPDAKAPIHRLDDKAFLAEVARLNGIPAQVLQHQELIDLILPTLRADFALHETYRYTARPPLSCPLTVFGGAYDPDVDEEQLAAWREQTTGSFQVELFPGDHFFINQYSDRMLQIITSV